MAMLVVEWTINNFSYWNQHVHERVLECSGSGYMYCPRMLLYPRGLRGSKQHLVVRVYVIRSSEPALSGHLSCIDSNGTVLCTQTISEREKKGDFFEIFLNFKFADVAVRSRKSETDRFTVRCQLLDYDDVISYRLFTTIDVFDSWVNIDLTKIKQVKYPYISIIQCPFDDPEEGSERLFIVREGAAFFIEPTSFAKNFAVSISLTVLKFGSVTRREENEYVFKKKEKWQFFNSLTKEQLKEEGTSLFLRIKIALGNKFKHHYCYHRGSRKAVEELPTNTIPISKTLPSKSPASTSSTPANRQSDLTKDFNTIPISKTLPSKSPASTSNIPANRLSDLTKDLKSLYKGGDFSDVLLRCGDVSFPTHKGILGARSPVFKAMLSSCASDSMDIDDLDAHTLGRFLVFLYTDAVEDLQWDGALRLYHAADKYQVPSLKRECFSVLRKNVSVSNVCDILSLAHKDKDEELTKEAQAFVLENFNDVFKSEDWKTFMIKEPLLVAKILTRFARKN